MTEKRIRAIAEKMVFAYAGSMGTTAPPFDQLSVELQASWIAAARIAVTELQRDPSPAKKRAPRRPKRTNKVCRILSGGKHECR